MEPDYSLPRSYFKIPPTIIGNQASADFTLFVGSKERVERRRLTEVDNTEELSEDHTLQKVFKGPEKRFLVCTGTLKQISPYFEVITSSHFYEGRTGAAYVQDVTTNAMEVLLNIAHHQHSNIPTMLSIDELFDLAKLCDKCDCFAIVHAYLPYWIYSHYKQLISGSPTLIDVIERCIFIGWYFKHQSFFTLACECLASRLARSVGEQEQWEVRNGSEYSPVLLEDLPDADGVFECITAYRTSCSTAIKGILDTFSTQILSSTYWCKHFDTRYCYGCEGDGDYFLNRCYKHRTKQEYCNAVISGAYYQGLRLAGVWAEQFDENLSLGSLFQSLEPIIFLPERMNAGECEHKVCFEAAIASWRRRLEEAAAKRFELTEKQQQHFILKCG